MTKIKNISGEQTSVKMKYAKSYEMSSQSPTSHADRA